MTLPLLILGLYLGLLVLGIGLCSWVGHLSPATEDARRVTDAAERAGLSHLGRPLGLAAGTTLLVSVLGGTYAISQGLSAVWFLLAPFLVPLLVAAAVFYSARKLLRASGQLIGVPSADGHISLMGRVTVGTVLVCDATIGLLLLGLYSLAVAELAPEQARFLILITGASLGTALVVFARAASAAHTAAGQEPEHGQGPHAASLARLVSTTFHAPVLRLLVLLVLSVLGHCVLLSSQPVAAESINALWLYPHLLKLLGLFALLFAGLVVRTSEEEVGTEGWSRGAIVYLVLMIAGAWSLSSELPASWGRAVPAGISFLYVALALAVWLSPSRTLAKGPRSLGEHAIVALPAASLFLGLVLALTLSTGASEGDDALPTPALLRLLLAGTLAAAPVGLAWLLARDLSEGSAQTGRLAYAMGRPIAPRTGPSPRLLVILPLLALVIAPCALSAGLTSDGSLDGRTLVVIGFGALLGALVVAALVGQMERACGKTITDVGQLIITQEAARDGLEAPDQAPLNFEAAVLLCKEAVKRTDVAWVLLCLAPFLAAIAGRSILQPPLFQSLAIGLGLGGVLVGVGLEYLEHRESTSARRTRASLSMVTGLAQAVWLLAAASFPT